MLNFNDIEKSLLIEGLENVLRRINRDKKAGKPVQRIKNEYKALISSIDKIQAL